MEYDLKTLIERLDSSSPQTLRQWHASLSDAQVPKRAKSTYTKGQIAWMEQAKAQGLEMATFQSNILHSLSQRNKQQSTPSPGTRLLREWHGRIYTVDVVPNGFAHDGEIYSNLSEIARLITGTRWSGPRFFGLKAAQRD